MADAIMSAYGSGARAEVKTMVGRLMTWCALVLLTGVLPAQELAVERRTGEEEWVAAILRGGPSELQIEVRSEGRVLTARMVRDEAGSLVSYERVARRADRRFPDAELRIQRREGGYELRESAQLGSRRKTLTMAPVEAVRDALWPELLVPMLLEEKRNSLRLLDVANHEALTGHLRERPKGARFLDLPEGGMTIERSPEGAFVRLVTPSLVVRARGAEATSGETMPEGVSETRLELDVAAVKLEAVLTRPRELPSGGAPGVLLLPDSGPRDVNGDPPVGGSALTRSLAWDLASRGYAVLRFAKREEQPTSVLQRGLNLLIADAATALRTLGVQEGVDRQRLAILGHGEGALLACTLARSSRDVKALVALNPPVQPLEAALMTRLDEEMEAAGTSEETREARRRLLREDIAALKEAALADLQGLGDQVMQRMLDIDPVRELAGPRQPLLVLFGNRSDQISAVHRTRFQASLALAREGPHEVIPLEKSDHDFLRIPEADARVASGVASADVALERDPAMLSALRDFLREHLQGSR